MAPVTRTYLDHAATTPMVAAAIDAVTTHLGDVGNPSSLHAAGRAARRVLEESREELAELLGAKPAEVIFTAGGTEADNLAIKGSYGARVRAEGRSRIVVSAVEHHAVLDPARWLASSAGADLREIGVDPVGRVRLDEVVAAVDDRTAVVSILWANNEIGTRQPVREVAQAARRVGAWCHSDAVQAVGHLPVDFAASGLDLMTVTAHKLGGPVGIGALIARREVGLEPVQHGGGQERDVRSGTLDVAAAAGFAAALRVAVTAEAGERKRLESLRAGLIAGRAGGRPGRSRARSCGPRGAAARGAEPRAARLLVRRLVAAVGRRRHRLLHRLGLHRRGVGTEPRAAGPRPYGAAGSVRPSASRWATRSTQADVDALATALPEVLARARAFGGVAG